MSEIELEEKEKQLEEIALQLGEKEKELTKREKALSDPRKKNNVFALNLLVTFLLLVLILFATGFYINVHHPTFFYDPPLPSIQNDNIA